MKKQRTRYRQDQAQALDRIEAKRARLNIEHQAMAEAAGIALSTYRRIRRRGAASLAQVNNLRFAIRTIAARQRASEAMFDGAEANDGVRKAVTMALKGIRAALVHSAIRPGDHRSVEIYLLVTACGVNGTLAAEVCGCTKQNVSKLLKSVEERREAADYDQAIAGLEAVIVGD